MSLFGNNRNRLNPDSANLAHLSAMVSHTLKHELIEVMVQEQLAEFEAKVRPLVEERVQGLSLKSIQQYMNIHDLSYDFNLKIDWRNPPEQARPK